MIGPSTSAEFVIRDTSDRAVTGVFASSWLGDWYEIEAHPWDRVSLETENVPGWGTSTPHAENWYATQGGVLGYDMDGNWVGDGEGADVYPSILVHRCMRHDGCVSPGGWPQVCPRGQKSSQRMM